MSKIELIPQLTYFTVRLEDISNSITFEKNFFSEEIMMRYLDDKYDPEVYDIISISRFTDYKVPDTKRREERINKRLREFIDEVGELPYETDIP